MAIALMGAGLAGTLGTSADSGLSMLASQRAASDMATLALSDYRHEGRKQTLREQLQKETDEWLKESEGERD